MVTRVIAVSKTRRIPFYVKDIIVKDGQDSNDVNDVNDVEDINNVDLTDIADPNSLELPNR